MKQFYSVLLTFLIVQLFAGNAMAAERYYNVNLEVTSGIELYGLTPGDLNIEEGDYLHLQFLPTSHQATAEMVTLTIDGVETPFKNFGDGRYFSYILNNVNADHDIRIAMKEVTVTLPQLEWGRMSPSAGQAKAYYGESFRFSILPYQPVDGKDIQVYANGVPLEEDLYGPSLMIYPAPLNYEIPSVDGPVTITVELVGIGVVTLPELVDARVMPSPGAHIVKAGEDFRFSLLPYQPVESGTVKVYVNGVELEEDLESPSILIYPAPLNYVIKNVHGPLNVTVEGLDAQGEIAAEPVYYAVDLPEVDGARMMPSSGRHAVTRGESFRFSLLPDPFVDTQLVKVYANGVELEQDLNGPSLDIYPAPLNYVIPEVTKDVVITVEGFVAHLSANSSLVTVTLPEVPGARMMPSAGTHVVTRGETFRFSILPDPTGMVPAAYVYVNDEPLEQDFNGPSVMIYPAPLNYRIDNVSESMVVRVEVPVICPEAVVLNSPASNVPMGDENLQILAGHQHVSIHANTTTAVTIYNLRGQQVAARTVTGSAQITLQPGLYVVRAGAVTEKVLIP